MNSHKKAAQVRGRKPKSSTATSITDEISAPVISQTISSQMTQMNSLFEHTLEDPDAKICDLAVKNLRQLKIGLSVTEHAHFFNLFLTQPALTQMYNQLVEGDEDDWWAYIRLKLKGLEDYLLPSHQDVDRQDDD